MIGLIIAVIIFNSIAFKTNRRLTTGQILHIWTFTIALQLAFDIYVIFRYKAYWYFSKDVIEWQALPAHLMLVSPVNMMFLNWYPFKRKLSKQILYFVYWTVGMLTYEIITMLPEPWGFFHYGWWSLWHSMVIDPVLLMILLRYYKLICKVEKNPS